MKVTRIIVFITALAALSQAATAATNAIIPSSNWATDSYIAEFTPGSNVHAVADSLVQTYGGNVTYYYEYTLTGMAFTTSSVSVANAINSDSRVTRTAQDTMGGVAQAGSTNALPGWALDRIDQQSPALNGRYSVGSRAGKGVSIYIVDSGITDVNGEWGSFPSRLENVFKYTSVDPDRPEVDYLDAYVFPLGGGGSAPGHGTQVAAIAAGQTFGVARGALIKNVKVTGSRTDTSRTSNVLAGLDAVYHHFTTHNINWHPGGRCTAGTGTQDNPSVVNMSLAFPKHVMLDDAVLNLIGAGVVVVTGAGNTSLTDISTVSPAHLGSAQCGGTLTVGASMLATSPVEDQIGLFANGQKSNSGVGVRIWAPGVAVDAVNGLGSAAKFDGTSAATPYVSGAVAKLLAENTGAPQTPDAVMTTIVNAATPNALKDPNTSCGGVHCAATLNGANNALLYIAPTAPAKKGDFDGDGKADIVWRNAATGANAAWLMDGVTFNAARILNFPGLSNQDYRIVGADDFDGDGHEDILWRNFANGNTALWLMNGATLQEVVNLPALTAMNYYIGGIGDFNNDGSVDILWRNGVTGANAVWLMNRTQFSSVVNLPPLNGANMVFEGVADFNNDGKTDILIRDYSAGSNSAWLMDGTTFVSSVSLPPLPNTDYHTGGVADYNGDG
ncbi:MAG: hypothetical protein JWO97_3250, partial [Acidobacteria bacterium]|nr:hypothetical protein [Acidobacteriota bacterium]